MRDGVKRRTIKRSRLAWMNGNEVTARLKRNMSTRHMPVVIDTAWSMACNIEERIQRALSAGAEEICISPFNSRCCVMC